MRAPSFWWRPDVTFAARCLSPAGALVGAVAARRMGRPPARKVAPAVLCIGNPTVGGSGKTPVAIAVAAALEAAGRAPVFLTRGYRGRLSGPLVVSDHGAAEVGDEALLLSRTAPTVVSRDRAAGGSLAAALGDIIVMDDGFQNPGLAKTWSALVIDASTGVGNARVTPAGPLRAPLRAHVPLADALIVADAGDAGASGALAVPGPLAQLPRHCVRLVPRARQPVAGEAVLAFAGIGRPGKFFAGLEHLGARVAATRPFPDHHAFTDAQLAGLRGEAARRGLRLATTAKDLVRLQTGTPAAQALATECLVVDVVADLPPDLLAALLAVCRAGGADEAGGGFAGRAA